MKVIFEDNHIIAINKSCSEIVQGDKTGDVSLDILVKEYIKKKYNKPGKVYLGVTHRIDRPVSGVVLFARTSKALSRLNKMFLNKEIKKTYWAIVSLGVINRNDNLHHYLTRDRHKNKSFAHKKFVPGSKLASLSYKTIKNIDRYSLLEIDLHTGRHHQIRCQLSSVGLPIKGDLKIWLSQVKPKWRYFSALQKS